MATVYRWWAAILTLAVVVQIGFAGYGAFNAAEKIEDNDSISKKAFEDGWDPHTGFGYIVFLGAVLLFLIALASRPGRRGVLWALAVPLLVILQIVLAWIGESVGWLGFLHPINAFVILGVLGSLTGRLWRGRATAPVATAP
jgi:heme A synthase